MSDCNKYHMLLNDEYTTRMQYKKACAELVAAYGTLRAQLSEAQARLAEIERQEPRSVVPVAVALKAVSYVGSANYESREREAKGWIHTATFDGYATPVSPAAPAAQAVADDVVPKALAALSSAMQSDPDFAWTWHCNIAMTAQDAGAPHDRSNVWAANFMQRAFGVDTLTRVNALLAAQQQKEGK